MYMVRLLKLGKLLLGRMAETEGKIPEVAKGLLDWAVENGHATNLEDAFNTLTLSGISVKELEDVRELIK